MKSRPSQETGNAGFRTRLERERLRQGYSQRKLGKLAGVSYQTIHNWESGKSVPRVGDQLADVALVLRVTVLYLLKGEE